VAGPDLGVVRAVGARHPLAMPLAVVILLAWFAVSVVVGPLVGMTMAAGRTPVAEDRAAGGSGTSGPSRTTTLGAA
jgi:hypothetical protein